MSKNQQAQRKLFKNNPAMNYGSSKSAKIVPSKSIFQFKNRRNLKKYQFRRLFFVKNIFSDFNF